MCLTHPAKIVSLDGNKAIVEDFNGKKLEVNVAALPQIKVNDWILLQANLAIQKITEKEAGAINNLFNNNRG